MLSWLKDHLDTKIISLGLIIIFSIVALSGSLDYGSGNKISKTTFLIESTITSYGEKEKLISIEEKTDINILASKRAAQQTMNNNYTSTTIQIIRTLDENDCPKLNTVDVDVPNVKLGELVNYDLNMSGDPYTMVLVKIVDSKFGIKSYNVYSTGEEGKISVNFLLQYEIGWNVGEYYFLVDDYHYQQCGSQLYDYNASFMVFNEVNKDNDIGLK